MVSRTPFRLATLVGFTLPMLVAVPLCASGTSKRSGPECIPLADTLQQVNPTKGRAPGGEVCIQAHVYDVVERGDGTRFLDVCPPEASDEECRFQLMSLREDREDVGDLRRFRSQDVSIRGTLRMYHGRLGIRISHVRQFEGGPEKFRPNPKLLHDFNGQSDRMPVRDPAMRTSGRHRAFMDRTDREELPPASKP